MRFILNNNGPYLIHCNEGKDRAGLVSALLECLMGATTDEVIDDYMVTYYNYYGVEQGTEAYAAIVKNNLVQVLATLFGVDDVYKADLAAEAEAFFMENVGLTAEEVASLKAKLQIALREVYAAGENLSALLGDRESVCVEVTSNGALLQEHYLSEQYSYFFYAPEYTDMGVAYSSLVTDHSQYNGYDEDYSCVAMLDPNGMIDMEAYFAAEGEIRFILPVELKGEAPSITEKDGCFVVTRVVEGDEIAMIDQGATSCVEIYTLDAKTREMTSVKTVLTYEDGRVEEYILTITRDAEIPEGAKPLLAYEQETENLRTITIVSNPGTDKERTDGIRVAKGVRVGFVPDWEVDTLFRAYMDAACTQPVPEVPDTNADITVYIKWDE
jgi:hypothetical protein